MCFAGLKKGEILYQARLQAAVQSAVAELAAEAVSPGEERSS